MKFHLVESAQENRILRFIKVIDKEFLPPLSDRVKLDEYANKLARGAINFFLVSEDLDIAHVAFYCNDLKFNVAYISSIGVIPEFHGSGIAGHLIEKVAERCIAEKMISLRLEVNGGNSKAIRFYGKHGFQFVSDNVMQKNLVDG